MALFGEKYGDQVRVVEIGDYSRELCGGTHVARSGQLGLVKLLSEASIGSGVRRVEALVGLDAFRYLAREHVLVSQLAEQFKARPEELPERIGGVVERLRAGRARAGEGARRRGAVLGGRARRRRGGRGRHGARGRSGARRRRRGGPPGAGLRRARTARRPAGRRRALHADDGGKVSFVVATTAAARDAGLAAGKLVPVFAPAVGGRGGGKPDLAQGGGTDPSGVPSAIDALRRELASR